MTSIVPGDPSRTAAYAEPDIDNLRAQKDQASQKLNSRFKITQGIYFKLQPITASSDYVLFVIVSQLLANSRLCCIANVENTEELKCQSIVINK